MLTRCFNRLFSIRSINRDFHTRERNSPRWTTRCGFIYMTLARLQETKSTIRFRAKLFRPKANEKTGSWTLTLPNNASAKLPSRGMTMVEGTINGFPFRAALEPNGKRSHWLRVNRKMREAAGADAGDVVSLEIAPAGEEPEPRVPADLRKALAAAPEARALWAGIK